jgi:hypothetical protein
MDLSTLGNTLQTGTPIAILVTIIGIIWQYTYRRSRDKLQDAQQKRESALEQERFERASALEQERFKRASALEQEKFNHQKALEELRFEYEQRRWREELGREMMIKLLEERLTAYTQLWGYIELAARSGLADLTIEKAHNTAREVHKWRYDKGGLLAEDSTRDAVREFQQALWRYDGSRESSQAMRAARRFVLRSLRADLGLGKNVSGQSIFQIVGERQEIGKELGEIRATTGESDS